MKIDNSKRKYKIWFDEICLGKQTIKQTGNSFVITIPKHFIYQNDLSKGDVVLPILFVRKKFLLGEKSKGEEWLKLTRKERIMFESFIKEKEELERETKKN